MRTSALKTLLVVVGILCVFGVPEVHATVSISPDTSGNAISVDTNSNNGTGAYTTLTGPTITDAATSDFPSSGTFVLSAPSGFAWNTGATVTASFTKTGGSGSTCANFSSLTATPTATTVTFTFNRASGSTRCRLAFSNLQVRPTNAGTTLSSGNIVDSGTGTIAGLTLNSTNLGTLTEATGTATQLVVSTQPSSTATAGSQFGTKPIVKVADQFGNIKTSGTGSTATISRSVVLSSQTCGGTAGGGALTTTPANASNATAGVLTYTAMTYTKAEAIKLCFTSTGLTSALSNTVTVSAGSLSSFAINTISTQLNGAAFNITVTAQDANANTVTSYAGTVDLTTTDTSISPTTSSSFTSGTLTQSVTLTGINTARTITVTDHGGSATGTSNTFDVNSSAALDHFSFGVISSPKVAGTPFNVTITAIDTGGNVYTGFTGTVDLTTTAGSISPTTSGSFTSGVRTESVTVTGTGLGKTISAKDHLGSAVGTSTTFTVNSSTGSPGLKMNVPTNFLTMNTGLVGWWPLDGKDINWATGTTFDRSGSGNDGAFTGLSTSSSPVLGKLGQALNFNGYSSVIETAAPSSLNGSSAFTASFWAAPTTTDTGNVALSIRSGTVDDSGFVIITDSSHAGFGPEVDWPAQSLTIKGSDPSLALINGKYHFYVFVSRSATDHELFVDGVSQGTSNTSLALANPLTNITIGAKYSAFGGSGFHSGPIDDVRVYNRALSNTEINQLYTVTSGGHRDMSIAGPGNVGSGLAGWWTFDGKNLVNNVADSSRQGSNAYLLGFTSTSSAVAIGKIGQALSFNGTAGFVQLPNDPFSSYPTLGSNTGSFNLSFSVWFKTTVGGPILFQDDGAAIPSNLPSGYVPAIYVDTTTGKIRATMFWHNATANQLVSGSSYTDGKWHHLVDTYGSGVETLYVDGAQVGTQTQNQYGYASGYAYYVGVGFNSGSGWNGLPANFSYFNGPLDDVRVYNKTLSASDVYQLYSMNKK